MAAALVIIGSYGVEGYTAFHLKVKFSYLVCELIMFYQQCKQFRFNKPPQADITIYSNKQHITT